MGKYILSQRFQAKAVISVSIIFVMTIHKIVSSTLAPLKHLYTVVHFILVLFSWLRYTCWWQLDVFHNLSREHLWSLCEIIPLHWNTTLLLKSPCAASHRSYYHQQQPYLHQTITQDELTDWETINILFLSQPFLSQDLICDSPYHHLYNSNYVTLESLLLGQLIIPYLISLFILIICLFDTVLIM